MDLHFLSARSRYKQFAFSISGITYTAKINSVEEGRRDKFIQLEKNIHQPNS